MNIYESYVVKPYTCAQFLGTMYLCHIFSKSLDKRSATFLWASVRSYIDIGMRDSFMNHFSVISYFLYTNVGLGIRIDICHPISLL